MKIETVPIDSVFQDPANARRHDTKNILAIKSSLARFGLQKPLVVTEDNVIRAGNGTWQAAKELGWKEISIIRTDLKGVEAVAYALADNRSSELASWDPVVLEAEISALTEEGWGEVDLSNLGFSAEDLKAIEDMGKDGNESNRGAGGGPVIEDEAPEPPIEAITKRGDLWILGAHRLLCGDSTKAEDVSRVMVREKAVLISTDPPYLVDYTGADRPGNAGKDWSNSYHEIDIDDAEKFFANAVVNAVVNAAWYWWHAHRRQSLIERIWDKYGIIAHQQIIWVKPTALHGFSFYPWRHEPCLFGWKKGYKPHHDGDNSHAITSVWDINWEGKSRIVGNEHPTQKPVEIFARPMRKHTQLNDICYEPFAGSGSQFIAAEQLGRRCFGLEIEPRYCDVIVARWEKFTGKKAVLEVALPLSVAVPALSSSSDNPA